MPSNCCSSSRHLPTRLLQLCPLRVTFIHATTIILGSTHSCSSNKRTKFQRPYHTYTERAALASYSCPNCIQNLPPHVSHPFPNLSIVPIYLIIIIIIFVFQIIIRVSNRTLIYNVCPKSALT